MFTVWPFRFHLLASEPVFFPPGKAGNVLRGSFGTIFRNTVCEPNCPGAATCRIDCPYSQVFEPRAGLTGPSGLRDWPRPFVFRAAHLDGTTIAPGGPFHFDLNLFAPPDNLLPHFEAAFRKTAEAGLGASRGRAELGHVEAFNPIEFAFQTAEPLERATLHFLSPTELKSGGEITDALDFGTLLRRLRDRISTLRACYQGAPLDLDFAQLGRTAEQVQTVRSNLRHLKFERRSSRTTQHHPIGGLVGEVEFAGVIAPFLPYLMAGQWTGVGRHTTWGQGAYQVHISS